MISVIVPVYNNPLELEKTLESLVRQSEVNPAYTGGASFEVVVVDDGSTEPIDSVISNFKFRILNLFYYRIEHGGAPKARNFGFEKSKGEYVLFCDADMELRSDCLQKMKKELDENLEIDFVYCDFKFGWKKFKFWEFDAKKLKELNFVNTCSMVRRERVVKWDESLEKFQDWDFWLTIVENGGKGKWIPEVLFKANLKRGTISKWLPKIVYKLPWVKMKTKEKYEYWKKIVQKKHGII